MAGIRFAVGIQRLIPWMGYHHLVMLIISASWIVSALLLAGCTSSTGAISNIYLLSIKYNNSPGSTAQSATLFGNASLGGHVSVRAGYLGLCARTTDQAPWICASGASGLGLDFASKDTDYDPLNAVDWAARFKSDVIFPGLLLGAMALSTLTFLGLATFPGWHEEHDPKTGSDIHVKPFPNRRVSNACLFFLCLASLFMSTSALWQHVAAASAASMITSATQGYLTGHVGPAAAAMIWLASGLVVVSTIMLVVMILSIHLLDRLSDD